MKKVVFIVLSVLSISISSCRKDEDILKQDTVVKRDNKAQLSKNMNSNAKNSDGTNPNEKQEPIPEIDNEGSLNKMEDPIIGKWSLVESYVNDKPETVSKCDKKGSVSFIADGTVTGEYYKQKPSDPKNCEKEDIKDTWKNLGDGHYEINTNDGKGNTLKWTWEITFEKDTYTVIDTQEHKINGVIEKEVFKYVYKRK